MDADPQRVNGKTGSVKAWINTSGTWAETPEVPAGNRKTGPGRHPNWPVYYRGLGLHTRQAFSDREGCGSSMWIGGALSMPRLGSGPHLQGGKYSANGQRGSSAHLQAHQRKRRQPGGARGGASLFSLYLYVGMVRGEIRVVFQERLAGLASTSSFIRAVVRVRVRVHVHLHRHAPCVSRSVSRNPNYPQTVGPWATGCIKQAGRAQE